MIRIYPALFVLASLVFSTTQAQTPCALDNTFNTNGTLITDAGRLCDRVQSLSSGQVLVVYNPFNSGQAYVRRLQNNGSIDNSYGSSGKASIVVSTYNTSIKSMYLKNDTVFACGSVSTGNSIYGFVAKIDPDGMLNSSFGTNGIVTYSNYFTWNKIFPDPSSGQLLLAGMKGTGTATVARMQSDGNLDNSFGTGGAANVSTSGTGIYYEIRDAMVDHTNSILLTGKYYTTQGSNIFTQLVVMRFTPTGSVDNSFDGDGVATFNSAVSHHDEGVRLFENAAGSYYITGACYDGMDWDYSLLKLNANGSADALFGNNGWKLYDLTGNQEDEYPLNAVMLSNEHILLTGNQGSGDTVHFSLLMVKPDGSLDNSFAPNGLFMHIFGTNNNNSSAGLNITNDGKIYLSGYSRTCQNGTCGPLSGGVARYLGSVAAASTGIQDVVQDHSFSIYPNPLTENNLLHIQTSGKPVRGVKVYSLLGACIPVQFIEPNTYRLESVARGLYYIQISTDDALRCLPLLVN